MTHNNPAGAPANDPRAARLAAEADFLPAEVEEEARAFGLDPDDPVQRVLLRSLLADDPDLGDWDAFQ